MTERTGDWMQTYTGRQFWPLDPREEDITAVDIAHSLSSICRYGGHTTRFYSVAEHCVLMSQAVRPEHAFWALLHDATEAYVGDMVRPLKRSMPEYVAVEDRVMEVIAKKYGLDPQGATMPSQVKDADNRIIVNEKAVVMTPSWHDWNIGGLLPLDVEVKCWAQEEAEVQYLRRFQELLSGKIESSLGLA